MRAQDMELVDQKRRLLCAGKLFRQPDHPFERGQIELFVMLLDNYRQCALCPPNFISAANNHPPQS